MIYVFYVPGMPFDGHTILRGESLGGSETAGLSMAREMARRGHRAIVFANIPTERQGNYDGVQYCSAGPANRETPFGASFQDFIARVPHDVLVAQRSPGALHASRAAKVNFWWIHDLAIKRHMPALAHMLWNTDRILCPSEFHARQAGEVYGLGREMFGILRNAIDPALFGDPPDPARKQRGKTLLYSSRPERGLENLVGDGGIMEKLHRIDPEIRLLVCGYDHTTPEMRDFYEHLWARCRAMPNVTLAGPLGKQALAETMRGAWLHVYPTQFEETSCITVMEAQAAGTPVLCPMLAGLEETLDRGGVEWVAFDGAEREKHVEFYVKAILAFRDMPKLWMQLHLRALKKGRKYRWENRAKHLELMVGQVLTERNSDPARVARHLMTHGEIIGLRGVMAGLAMTIADAAANPILHKTHDELRDCYDFVETGDYAGHYDRFYQSEVEKGVKYGVTLVDGDPRYRRTVEVLEGVDPHTARVLDWGCAHGPQTVNLAQRFPAMEFLGVELAGSNVKIAREWAKSWKLDNVKFITVEAFLKQEMKHPGKYDVVMCQEVLEHCPDAGAQLDKLVPYAKAGALFILSTPTGPVEYVSRLQSDWDWNWRGHIQHLETADLFALFGHHPDFAIDHLFWQTWRDHPIGWSFMTFRKPTAPSGKLDMAARLAAQAPRETLTACLITRADTKTLAKCLDILKGRADQIVIGIDMGKEASGPKEGAAWAIAEEYGAEAFGIVSPLEQGFDAARNETLLRAVGDWILWIDDDEELINPERLHKYLRPNCYDGYAIRQSHFALEPRGVIKADYPCRLFRNHRGMRFFGVVHEHPELKFNEGPGRLFMIPDVEICHNGYITEKARRLRFERNWPLMQRDREKYPDRKLGRFLWLRDLCHQNRFDFEKFHAVTDQMRERADEGIAVWRALVAEGEARLATDGLPYYSDLAEMTQAPVIEYVFATHVRALGGEKRSANPIPEMGNPDDPAIKGLFANMDDLRAYTDLMRDEFCADITEGRYL